MKIWRKFDYLINDMTAMTDVRWKQLCQKIDGIAESDFSYLSDVLIYEEILTAALKDHSEKAQGRADRDQEGMMWVKK